MKIFTIILTFLIFSSCKTENKKTTRNIESNTILMTNEFENQKNIKPKHQTNTDSIYLGKQIMVSSGQMSSSMEIRINGCLFDAVIKENNDTIYIATNDSKFTTPENFKVGMKLSQIPVDFKQNIQQENGWGYYIELESKWCLGFCEGTSCTDENLTSNSKVKWIFKRK